MIASPQSTTLLRRAAFFDRDGVLNLDHGYVSTPDRVELVQGAAAAVRTCNEAGLPVFVVTNQSGIGRGYFSVDDLQQIHARLRGLLAAEGATIDDIRFCPHHVDAVVSAYRRACDWRKPAPGMILDLAREWRIDLPGSFLIGDKPSDMAAAAAAGLPATFFTGGDLLSFLRPIIAGVLSAVEG